MHPGIADGSVLDLASDGSVVVALVSGTEPSIWSSADGRTWEEEQNLGFNAYQALVAGSGGFVVVGQRDTGAMNFVASTWTSPDGHAWTQTDLTNPATPVEGATIGPDGTVILMGTCTGPSKEDMTEAICGSALKNGEWSAIESPTFQDGVFGDITAGPNGYLLVGQVRGMTFPQSGAVWTSVDGVSWERQTPESFASLLFWGAAAGDSAMVAVGSTMPAANGFGPTGFYSTDGQTWVALPNLPALLGSGPAVGRFRAAGELADGRLIVSGVTMGTTESGPQVLPLLLILGSDGTWEPVTDAMVPVSQGDGSGGFELGTIALFGDRVLVGGNDSEGAVIWVGEPAT